MARELDRQRQPTIFLRKRIKVCMPNGILKNCGISMAAKERNLLWSERRLYLCKGAVNVLPSKRFNQLVSESGFAGLNAFQTVSERYFSVWTFVMSFLKKFAISGLHRELPAWTNITEPIMWTRIMNPHHGPPTGTSIVDPSIMTASLPSFLDLSRYCA